MKIFRFPCFAIGCAMIAACAKELPPPSVDELLANRVLLDAMMSKCVNDRSRMKYEPECVNAREAANIIARAEEAERRKRLEAQSERKRAALRRAQEAAEEARRRAEEAARRRREEEYLGLFEPVAGNGDDSEAAAAPEQMTAQEYPLETGEATDASAESVAPTVTEEDFEPGEAAVAADEEAVIDATGDDEAQDLGAIREELRRRNDGVSRGEPSSDGLGRSRQSPRRRRVLLPGPWGQLQRVGKLRHGGRGPGRGSRSGDRRRVDHHSRQQSQHQLQWQ